MINLAYALGVIHPEQGAQVPPPSPLISFLPLIIIFVIFYFLLIKPQRTKQKEHAMMVAGIKKSDKVVTSGGIHGIVADVKKDTVILKVDKDTTIEIQRNSIGFIKQA